MYTYRKVLNVSTRFYFSVYVTISLVRRCLCRGLLRSILPSNTIYLGHRQLQQYQLYKPPFLVLERNQLLLRLVSTCDNHAVFLQCTMYTQLSAVPFCIVVCIPARAGLLNAPCYASLWTVLHYVYIIIQSQ